MIAEMIEIKTLGDVYDVRDGTHDSPKYQDEGYALITSKNLKPEGLNRNKVKFISEVDFQKINERSQVHVGDILFAMIGTIGNPVIVEETPDYAIKNVALFKVDKHQSSKYLRYYLLSDYVISKMQKEAKGTTQRFVGLGYLRKFPIPIPSLPEQERIVAILDTAFEAIDQAKQNVERNLHNAKELFQSKLNEVFSQKGDGWVEGTVGDIGKVSMCKRILKHQTTPTGDIPFYKIGTFGKEPDAFISKDIYNEFREKFSFPKEGDVLISASGTIGRRVIYDGKPAYFQDSNIVWIDNDEQQVLNDYLFQFYGGCDWNSTKGATISRLYNSNLRQIRISFPKSLEKQQLIVHQLETLSVQTKELETNYTQKLTELEDLKKSLLERAFKGEV